MKTALRLTTCLTISVACGTAFAADPPAPMLDGAAIDPDAALEAPDGARELDLPDGVHVTLYAGASARLGRPAWFPAEHGGKSARGYRLHVRQGDVTIRVPGDPRGLSGLSVTTKSGDTILGWRGTVRLSVGASTSRAEVLDGVAFIGAHDKWTVVRGPSGIAFDAGGNADLHHPLLGAPAWVDAHPKLALVSGEERPSLAWRAVPHATAYKVEIASDGRVVAIAQGESLRLETPALPSGRYVARVSAIGSDGMVGEPSAPLSFHVVRAALPAGAIVASDGAVVVREGSLVTLDDPRGLELAVAEADDAASARSAAERSDVFSPHPAGLGPTHKPASVVRIRDTETHAEATMVLVRRQLRARVEMTPRLARWPQDPVAVRVVLADPSGRIDPAKEAVAVDVRIDGRPLALPWQETRSPAERSWTARIEPRTGAGPWIIDVQVKDAAGTLLGESLLDVDGPRSASR